MNVVEASGPDFISVLDNFTTLPFPLESCVLNAGNAPNHAICCGFNVVEIYDKILFFWGYDIGLKRCKTFAVHFTVLINSAIFKAYYKQSFETHGI